MAPLQNFMRYGARPLGLARSDAGPLVHAPVPFPHAWPNPTRTILTRYILNSRLDVNVRVAWCVVAILLPLLDGERVVLLAW